jgi:nucleotide-binding universal stress UspA family protein
VEANVFARIVCGVDGTAASTVAVRRAAQLADADSRLVLVTVASDATMAAATAGAAGMVLLPAVEEAGRASLGQGIEVVRNEFPKLRVEGRVLDGPLLPTLVGVLTDSNATLAVVGRHGHSRLAGLVLGSVTTALLHDAPCSVLVAAGGDPEEGPFPASIVVGYDGSEQADEAMRVAAGLAHRTGALLQAVCATGGKAVDLDRLQARLTALAPGVSLAVQDAAPADALDAQDCDLLVVGCRGLHGLKALGSVSERVAHRADCSVLVVRSPV